MGTFIITVPVECDTLAEAERVATERLGHDEDYGFTYQFGPTDVAARARNLAHFTEEDAATLLGRPITDEEYRRLVKSLPHSTMGEAFTEVVHSVCGYPDDEEEGTDG